MNVLSYGQTFWISLIGGGVTGMGNGSVFGATLMCALGRGRFETWGGWFGSAYNPVTFHGFMDWSMFIFGIAFFVIMALALKRHGELERDATS